MISAGILGAILAIAGLLSAPWQVLLVFLVLVLGLTQWYLMQFQRKISDGESFQELPPPPAPSQPFSKDTSLDCKTLSYRGAKYAPSATDSSALGKSSIIGKYRGAIWRSFQR